MVNSIFPNLTRIKKKERPLREDFLPIWKYGFFPARRSLSQIGIFKSLYSFQRIGALHNILPVSLTTPSSCIILPVTYGSSFRRPPARLACLVTRGDKWGFLCYVLHTWCSSIPRLSMKMDSRLRIIWIPNSGPARLLCTVRQVLNQVPRLFFDP